MTRFTGQVSPCVSCVTLRPCRAPSRPGARRSPPGAPTTRRAANPARKARPRPWQRTGPRPANRKAGVEAEGGDGRRPPAPPPGALRAQRAGAEGGDGAKRQPGQRERTPPGVRGRKHPNPDTRRPGRPAPATAQPAAPSALIGFAQRREDRKGHATRSTIARKQIANFRRVGKWLFDERALAAPAKQRSDQGNRCNTDRNQLQCRHDQRHDYQGGSEYRQNPHRSPGEQEPVAHPP